MSSLLHPRKDSLQLTPRRQRDIFLAAAVADFVRPVRGGRRSGAGRKPAAPMTLVTAAAILEDLAAAVRSGQGSRHDLARRIFRDAMRARRRVLRGADHA